LPEAQKIFLYLFNKEFNKLPKMGKCELFCAILFSQGQKDAKKSGDVQIGSSELEVKAGKSRLGRTKRIWR
jgi:hypothetical protein